MAINIQSKARGNAGELQIGAVGKRRVNTTADQTSLNVGVIHAHADTVFESITDETLDNGALAGLALKAGDNYFGIITQFKLTSGDVVAYYR